MTEAMVAEHVTEVTPLVGEPGGLGAWSIDVEVARGVLADGTEVVAKSPRPHLAMLPGTDARAAVAADLARAGLGPAVHTDAADVIVQDFVDAPWQTGTLGRAVAYGSLPALIVARRRFREFAADLPGRDLVADVRALEVLLTTQGFPVSADLGRLLALVDPIAAAVANGPTAQPSLGAADLSSVMLHPDGRVLLLGGTFAGSTDPLADVGMLLAEVSPTIIDAAEVLSLAWGPVTAGALARAELYAVLADLRSSLWSVLAALADPATADGYWGHHGFVTRRALFAAGSATVLDARIARANAGWEA